jgi:Winged helix-turn-helix domain (DUF2582)
LLSGGADIIAAIKFFSFPKLSRLATLEIHGSIRRKRCSPRKTHPLTQDSPKSVPRGVDHLLVIFRQRAGKFPVTAGRHARFENKRTIVSPTNTRQSKGRKKSTMELKVTVGETAGKIYEALASGGPQTVTQLKKKLNGSGELVNFALGWLAREDKIDIVKEKKAIHVQLK